MKKPIMKLKVGWEDALKLLVVPHKGKCTCGCKTMQTFKSRVKEISKMISSGEAVVV